MDINKQRYIDNFIQLYLYTHIQYIHTKGKDIDYVFDEYFFNLEKMIHGYELSLSTNFDDDKHYEYKSFKEIIKIFISISLINDNNRSTTIDNFKELLLKNFFFSSNYLEEKRNLVIIDKKLTY
jgi:hypothetical protein